MTKFLSNTFILLVLVSCAGMKKIVKLDKPQKNENIFHLSWIKNLDPIYNTGNLPIGTASPYVFEDIVYMGNLSGEMKAYDIETGKVIWSTNEKSPIQSQVNKRDDFIYYGTKTGRLFSRHYLTGKLNYAIDLGSPIESQPSFVQGRLVIHLRNHTLISLDARTGKVFWRYKRSVPYLTTLQRVAQVLPYKNSLILGFADGHLVSLSIEEGVINWEQKLSTGFKFVDIDVNAIMYNGLVVAGSASGPMRMINPTNGVIERTIEIYQSHTPFKDGNDLIVGSVTGVVYRIDKYGKIKSQRKVTDDGISSIVKWKNGYVVTTMGEKVFHLNLKNFQEMAQFDLGSDQSAVFGTSVLGEEHLTLYSSRNRLYIFK